MIKKRAIQLINFVDYLKNLIKVIFIKKNNNYFILDLKDLLSERIPKNINCESDTLHKNAKFHAGKKIVIEGQTRKISIFGNYRKKAFLTNMSREGIEGIELYIDNKTILLKPKSIFSMEVNEKIYVNNINNKIVLYLPLYSQLDDLLICSDEKLSIKYDLDLPIIFYGSSITQGCSASIPSKTYVNIIGDRLNTPIENYGFSESAFGEKDIISYISKRKTNMFIIEFDHNADLKTFSSRHLEMYKTIRMNNKQAFIIFLSRLSSGLSNTSDENQLRKNIIFKTLAYAKSVHDDRVIYIDGSTLLLSDKREYFSDDRHPNDKGMSILANAILKEIEKIEV